MKPRLFFSPRYDMHFLKLEKLHPFDTRKYSRAYHRVRERFGPHLRDLTITPPHPVSDQDLLLVHTPTYLQQLRSRSYLAQALEFPLLRLMPYVLVEHRLLIPMRTATQGTLMAAQHALEHRLAVNLGGGYHHASRDKGEGFCLFADVPLAIEKLRAVGDLQRDDPVLIVDLDVHQGNGHERAHMDDPAVTIFDMYNRYLYPGDKTAAQRINYKVELNGGLNDFSYLETLKRHFGAVVKAVTQPDHPQFKLAFYIAGTDIYEQDALGRLKVTEEGVLARDVWMLETLVGMGIPTVMVLGGGYSADSYRLVANTVEHILKTWG